MRARETKVFAPTFPTEYEYGGFKYQVIPVTPQNKEELRALAHPYEKLVGYDDARARREAEINIKRGAEVVTVSTLGRLSRVIGLVSYEVMKVDTENQGVLTGIHIGIKGIDPRYQKNGIGTQLSVDAILRYVPDFITGTSRKWEVMRTYQKTGFLIDNGISPIDRPLPMWAAVAWRQMLDESVFSKIDTATGRYPDRYPPVGDMDELRPPRGHIAGWRIFDIMQAILAPNPQGTHALAYIAEVDQRAVLARIGQITEGHYINPTRDTSVLSPDDRASNRFNRSNIQDIGLIDRVGRPLILAAA